MRLNKFLALHTGLSRRSADKAIANGRVRVNDQLATIGQEVTPTDHVRVDGQPVSPDTNITTIMLHKPVGYVCSRDGQGSKTIYDILPEDLRNLKPVGRLDKDSSGLLLLTNDGQLAQQLTHPSFQKLKRYIVTLDHELATGDFEKITDQGVLLEDGVSKFALKAIGNVRTHYEVIMHEGRNRQIRRTFAVLGYQVTQLHRVTFGDYQLGQLPEGHYQVAATLD